MEVSPLVIGVIGVIAFLVLFFLELPVGIALLLVGFIGIWAISGLPVALHVIGNVPYRTSITYVWSLIPLFVFMGQLAHSTGMGGDLFYVASKWLGHLRGGLAFTSVGTSAAFGAVCGDNIAAVVTMTTVCLPEMRKYNYDDSLSLGSICAGGLLSFLIPPSLGFIVYGILVNESIGDLFLAGTLPGILTALLYMVAIFIIGRVNPKLGPKGPRATWLERLTSIKELWGPVLLVLIVFGGIYSGFITPTEAGALGAFAVLVIGVARRKLSWEGFKHALVSTLDTTGMVFLLLLGAFTFSPFLALTTFPQALVDLMSGWSPWAVLAAILVFYFLSGLVFEPFILLVITAPLFLPLWLAAGFDMVWFGVVLMLIIVVGAVTPPVGLAVFVVGGMVPEVSISRIFKGVAPFIPAILVSCALVVVFPQIALFLPNLLH
jgi:tripartite ATP-independent transporter DctM subunit